MIWTIFEMTRQLKFKNVYPALYMFNQYAVRAAEVSVKWIDFLRHLGWLYTACVNFSKSFEKFCLVTRYEVLPLETDWRVIIYVGKQ